MARKPPILPKFKKPRLPLVSIAWNRTNYERQVFDQLRNRIQVAGRYLQALVKQNISVSVSYSGNKVIRSRPGEYPRIEFGKLRDSIKLTYDAGGLAFLVSINVDYGVRLETDRKMRRSFLVRTLKEHWQGIKKIMISPYGPGMGGVKFSSAGIFTIP
mgnify:CR=1 FL=1